MNDLRIFVIKPEDEDRLRYFFHKIGNKNDQPFAYHYISGVGRPVYLKYRTCVSDEDYAILKLTFEIWDKYPL